MTTKYNHKALVNYYAKLVSKEVYKKEDIPEDIKDEVLEKVEKIKKSSMNV